MRFLLHDSHTPNGGGAPGEAEYIFALNDEIERRATAAGIVVTRVPGNQRAYPEFRRDYDAFIALHYDADIYRHNGQKVGGWFWDRGKRSLTATTDDVLGHIFERRYSLLPNVPPHISRRNANTWDYYAFRLTSRKTPGIIVELGVGAPAAPDHDWLRANVPAIANVVVATFLEFVGQDAPHVTVNGDTFWMHSTDEPLTWGDLYEYARRLQKQLDNNYKRK